GRRPAALSGSSSRWRRDGQARNLPGSHRDPTRDLRPPIIPNRTDAKHYCARDRRGGGGSGVPKGCISCIAPPKYYILHSGERIGRSIAARQIPCSRGKMEFARFEGMMTKTTHTKLVIIGSGPAGYTAAIYAA